MVYFVTVGQYHNSGVTDTSIIYCIILTNNSYYGVLPPRNSLSITPTNSPLYLPAKLDLRKGLQRTIGHLHGRLKVH